MDVKNIYTIILLIFIWLVGATITILCLLYNGNLILAILSMLLPYYITKDLLVREDNSEKGEI